MLNLKDLAKEFSNLQKATKLLHLCSKLHEGVRREKLEENLLNYLGWPIPDPSILETEMVGPEIENSFMDGVDHLPSFFLNEDGELIDLEDLDSDFKSNGKAILLKE